MEGHNHIKNIESILSAVKIKNSFSYSWLNETILLIPPNLKKKLPEDLLKLHLVNSLTQNLYDNFYCKGSIASTKKLSARIFLPTLKLDYLKQLSASNNGQGYLDDEWTIISKQPGRLEVVKNGLKLILKKSEYVSTHNDLSTAVFQCMPKDHYFISPGFYTAFGNTDLQLIDVSPTIRFYWNIHARSYSFDVCYNVGVKQSRITLQA